MGTGRDTSPRVELHLAGAFGVIRDGTELSEGELGSRKSRTLLKLLAVERPALVSLDRIVEVLWADNPPAAAGQNVATLVSRLRGVLGPGVILGSRQAYRLAEEPAVIVDLDAAGRYCGQAELKLGGSPAIALAAAEQAIGLLAADVALADEPYATWVDPARDQLRNLARRARLAAAEAALATDDARTAIRHAEAAIAADPLDEAAYRWYMSACAAAGEPAKALMAYATLRDRLAEELGADPAPETREIHLALLRQHPSQLPRSPHPSRPPRPTGPTLVGREAETAALREAWGRAVAADPGLVMIIGEAGIGKTALAEDLAARGGRDRRHRAAHALLRGRAVPVPAADRGGAGAGRGQDDRERPAGTARRARAGGRGSAARGGRAARASPTLARQPGHGTAPVLRGADRAPGRAGRTRPRPARRGRPAVRGAVHRRVHPLPRPPRIGLPAAGGGDRPGRA